MNHQQGMLGVAVKPVFDSDENFALIIGYTRAGFPYGVAHEDMAEIEKNELE